MSKVMMFMMAIALFILSMVLVMVTEPMYSLVPLLLAVALLTTLFIKVVER